jgi:CRISPR/Cas system-associated exonuclease Cas4 (RecB family)
MSLADNFQFSSTGLQDYVDCPRRFQLRYLLNIAWPAPQMEPLLESERYVRLARDFHRLAHQHALGISEEALSRGIAEAALAQWWRNYLAFVPQLPAGKLYPEVGLSAPLTGQRLIAQYDLLVVPQDGEGRLLVVEWKAYRRRPRRPWLAGRLQTRVYRYVGSQAGGQFSGVRPTPPEQVEMIYWFANFPGDPERFPYSAAEQAADRVYLADLIAEIKGREEEIWPLTADERRCLYCNYRSLCERGTVAGSWEGAEDDFALDDEAGFDFDLDLGQVQEIAY